ncbi:splicing factor 45, partial [Diaphorina citri]|uniref:Splicing factor 45 n=1 Tax=Diaphorina citri TaxID=121845 RepID=A0A1S3DNS6_DIACI
SDPGESRRATGNSSDSDSDTETPAFSSSATPIRKGGAAIAPPPSLQESSGGNSRPDPKSFGASVAAKIMAKYGFREGQGLGKKEQGMSSALQVEKTSKRGGRIIHEKDIMPPPSLAPPSAQ